MRSLLMTTAFISGGLHCARQETSLSEWAQHVSQFAMLLADDDSHTNVLRCFCQA